MASRTIKTVAISALLVSGAGGYLIYRANAAQAQGALAQAPLNNQVQTPPAFIMALDNSGSMRTDETLFRTGNGQAHFRYSNNSFFTGDSPWGSLSGGGFSIFTHMTAGDGFNANLNADTYGALRSPEHNRAYFNPHATYTPWLKGDESNDNNALVTAAPPDPRGSCSTGSRCLSNNAAKFTDATYDFTTYRQVTETWRAGFTMPAGTEYFNDQACNSPSGVPTAAWSTLAADFTFGTNCSTTFRYYPARVYLSTSAPEPPGFDVSRRVLIRGIGPSGTDMYRYDIIASNFTTGGAEAVQNFANWWTYYGNRNRALIAGITNALKGLNNMRVAAFEFVDPPALTTNLTMHDMGSPVEKSTLINQIRNLRANGGSTPSRRGTAFMINQFHRTDTGAPVKFECQRNAAMLFTDGYTNDSGGSIATISSYFDVGDQDNALGAPYGGAPYSGGVASQNTIADYAMWGYLTNPRPDLALGRVPVPASCPAAGAGIDCNPNLHVNFYGVTLGARGAIYDVNAAATANPHANPPSWTATSTTNLNPANVDDIWHASLNARGEFINASTPRDITDAMRRILQIVSSGTSPSGSLAMTGARIGSRSLTVIPSYEIRNEGTDWYSYLHASKPSLDLTTGAVTETSAWEASTMLTAPGRGSHTWYGESSSQVRLFNSTNIDAIGGLSRFCIGNPYLSRCTGAELATLVANSAEAIDYFLGDKSNEVVNGGKLRSRTTVLGDIINSTPVVSAPTDDYGYRALPAPYGSSYDTYMATTKTSRPVMVYVGANDGMLHAFHGGINHEGNPMGTGGQEQFAYIPRSVLGHMGNLLFPYVAADGGDQKFDHRYYVDGPITVGDAYFGGGWKTALVGTTGAGGRSVFALNVSDPTNFTASSRLWEIDDQHPTNEVARNIGHVLGKPVIVPVRAPGPSGVVSWKAIFGNGYDSLGTDCSLIPPVVCKQNAVLFVVDLATGNVRMIKAEESAAPNGPNGLGNIAVVDRRDSVSGLNIRDGFADTVYASDRKGAVWRFNLLDTSDTTLTTPLFVTQAVDGGNRQPIIGGLTATAGRGGGVMVLFGTGSFSFVGDSSDTTLQSLYGIQDDGGAITATIPLSDLFERQIAVNISTGARTITPGGPSLGDRGWYVDLPTGERMVSYPRVASGVVFIPTYQPTAGAGCSTGGENWMYGLNTRTGAPALDGVRFGSTSGNTAAAHHGSVGIGALRLNTSGSAPVKDVGVSLLSTSRPIIPGEHRCWMRISVAGLGQPMFVPYPCGRQSWRQLQ